MISILSLTLVISKVKPFGRSLTCSWEKPLLPCSPQRVAASASAAHFLLEGDALLVTLAVNHPSTFSSWHFSSYVSDIILVLSSFQSWHVLKVSKCVNYRAHALDIILVLSSFQSWHVLKVFKCVNYRAHALVK